jgi:hypothetical protein
MNKTQENKYRKHLIEFCQSVMKSGLDIPHCGLCLNFEGYCLQVEKVSYKEYDNIQRYLQGLFEEIGLHKGYPFDGGSWTKYNLEDRNFRDRMENPLRAKFVEIFANMKP